MIEQTATNQDTVFWGEFRMMVSKTKAVLAGLALAGVIFLSLGVAQASERLTAAEETRILALIVHAGDSAFSEQALTDMVAANPGAAKEIADFATRPANQPAYTEGVTIAVEGALIVLAAADTQDGSAVDDDSIGVAGVFEGTVIAMRLDGSVVALEIDSLVYSGDLMETGTDSSLGLVFIDETTFSMGEDSVMMIDELVYDPEENAGIMKLSLIEGTFALLTGAIAPSGPDAMTISSQISTIGIRGTKLVTQTTTTLIDSSKNESFMQTMVGNGVTFSGFTTGGSFPEL